VWLDATNDELNERVRASEHRPLLDSGSAARLGALRGERQAHYEAVANIRIDTSAMSIDDVVRVIEDHLTREHVS
jgi:shikimate kinase